MHALSTWIPVSVAALVISACGGESANGTGGGNTSTTTNTTTTATGSGGSTSTTTATGTGGELVGETVTLTMDSFDVPPGGEVYKCQNFVNPFGGADAEVAAFASHMTAGSHHLLLFYKDDVTANSALEDCSGLEFAATPYSTQLPDDQIVLPQGVAALVKGTSGMRLQSHYLNTTSETIKANITMTFHLAEPGTVTAHAGVLFVVEPQIAVAPNSTKVIKHDCSLPYDMNLIKAASHMHKHGTNFEATIGGETVYQTTTWNDPKPAVFDPAKAVKGGDPLHFECTFVNTSTSFLTFGESAQNNEMCIFVSAFYPVKDGGSVTVGCN